MFPAVTDTLMGVRKARIIEGGGIVCGWETSGEARWITATNEDIIPISSGLTASASERYFICCYDSPLRDDTLRRDDCAERRLTYCFKDTHVHSCT